jgi:hypothetical protein
MNLKELLSKHNEVVCEAILNEKFDRAAIVETIGETWSAQVEELEIISEALISERVNKELSEAKKAIEEANSVEMDKLTKLCAERLDDYADAAIKYVHENFEERLISEARVEIVDNFYIKLKNLFNENSIEIDTDSKGQLEILENKTKELENKLNNILNENIELKKDLVGHKFTSIFESVRSELKLSDTQADRLRILSESINKDEKIDHNLRLLAKTLVVEEKKEKEKAPVADSKEKLIIEGTDELDPLFSGYVLDETEQDSLDAF